MNYALMNYYIIDYYTVLCARDKKGELNLKIVISYILDRIWEGPGGSWEVARPKSLHLQFLQLPIQQDLKH